MKIYINLNSNKALQKAFFDLQHAIYYLEIIQKQDLKSIAVFQVDEKLLSETKEFTHELFPNVIMAYKYAWINTKNLTANQQILTFPSSNITSHKNYKTYQQIWHDKADVHKRIEEILLKYQRGPLFGFFRNHKNKANTLLRTIKVNNDINEIYFSVLLEVQTLKANNNLSGDYGTALQVILTELKEYVRNNFLTHSQARI